MLRFCVVRWRNLRKNTVCMFSVLYYILLLSVTLVFFLVMCVAWFLTVLFDRDRVVLHWLSRMWTAVYFGMVPSWRRHVTGMDNVGKNETYVVVVNHKSMLDIPLMYVLPFNFKWVSKREVYKWPLFGWVLWMHGDIAIERGGVKSLRKLVDDGKRYLARGISVVIFPEGTRSKTDGLGRFHEGAFMLAKQAGVAVLPCVTVGTGTAFNGWRFNFQNKFRVHILPPVSAERVLASDAKELMAVVREMMDAEYEKMKAIS